MKRTIFTLLLAVLFVGGMFAQGTTPRPTAAIAKAAVAPTIDGIADDLWADVAQHDITLNFWHNDGTNPKVEELPTVGDPGETYWKMLWDDNGLYILVHVVDDIFSPALLLPNNYMYDKIEMYFDCNYDLVVEGAPGDGHTAGHYQVAPGFTESFYAGGEQADGTRIFGHLVEDPNWQMEYFIPWDFLLDKDGNNFIQTNEMGFDVTVIDNDTPGVEGRQRMVWSCDNNTTEGSLDESWSNSDGIGRITFEGAAEVVFVTGITVSAPATEITMDNGTLQLSAAVLPENASNTSVKWTVAGPASINADGVLMAKKNGTATVTATSKDGTGITATYEVTISNQFLTKDEANIFVNAGAFDIADQTGYPASWGGWLDGADNTLSIAGGVLNGSSVNWATEWWHWQFVQVGNDVGWAVENDVAYVLMFDAWADAERTGYCDFEDPNNGYVRFGTSVHADSKNPTDGDVGRAGWTFNMPTEATTFTYDMVGNSVVETTKHQFGFMMSCGDAGAFYLDNLYFLKVADVDFIAAQVAATAVTVTGAGGVAAIDVKAGTLQMSAAVEPANVTVPGVIWSVEGDFATISETGLLTAVSDGTVKVKAMSADHQAVGTLDVVISNQSGLNDLNSRSFRMYPNPVVDVLYVNTNVANSNIAIYNGVGQKVAEMVATGTKARFDVRDFAQGVYFVRVNNGAAEKFVK